MDGRVDPVSLLGLKSGTAQIIRNAGGIVTDDVIRSLSISQRVLGTEEITLIQHTDCGMLRITDQAFASSIQKETGVKPPWTPGAFSDLYGSVRQGLDRIRSSPFIPKREGVQGFVYDLDSGRLNEVSKTGGVPGSRVHSKGAGSNPQWGGWW
jgi:carbonic anhydrase